MSYGSDLTVTTEARGGVALPAMERLLAHRPPMILLDRMVEWERASAVCELTVRDGAMFVRDGRVPAVVFLEYMAQAVGAQVGHGDYLAGIPVRIGYLVGARDVNLFVDSASVGDRLVVHVKHRWGDDQVGSFRAEVRRGDEVIASASLNVYRGDLGAMQG